MMKRKSIRGLYEKVAVCCRAFGIRLHSTRTCHVQCSRQWCGEWVQRGDGSTSADSSPATNNGLDNEQRPIIPVRQCRRSAIQLSDHRKEYHLLLIASAPFTVATLRRASSSSAIALRSFTAETQPLPASTINFAGTPETMSLSLTRVMLLTDLLTRALLTSSQTRHSTTFRLSVARTICSVRTAAWVLAFASSISSSAEPIVRTFAYQFTAMEVGIDYLTIKRLLNHKSNDITSQYIQWHSRENLTMMRETLEKIKY